MSIVNRRNAVVGWAAIKAGKYFAKKKARGAVPGKGSGPGSRATKIGSGVAAAIAAAAGALMFWRRRREPGGTG
jgi:hypothetical protein